MSGRQQPFLYDAVSNSDRFPQTVFDPKAVTRASFEPERARPKQNGPLVNFNKHPDSHMVLNHRSTNYRSLSPRMKGWIKGIRIAQLALRVLELIAAAGVLFLFIIFTNVGTSTIWILRIAPGIAMLHCMYGIWHLSHPAGARTPASSAAYQLFSGISDVCMMPIYGFGFFVTRTFGTSWDSLLKMDNLMAYFLPAAEYTCLAAGCLHLISLLFSIWLGWVFRKIAMMPPDLNPLEDRFTTRAKHRKSKSSIATTMTGDSEKRLSTANSSKRGSVLPSQDLSRPPSIPFMHTRNDSSSSIYSRDSRADLPSRNYQIAHGNSPRNSVQSQDTRRLSRPTSHRGSYAELPHHDSSPTRPGSGISHNSGLNGEPQRVAKFTETWFASDSLISRTQQRNRDMNRNQQRKSQQPQAYETIGQQRYGGYGDDSDSENDENHYGAGGAYDGDLGQRQGSNHPSPLRSNPPSTKQPSYPDMRASALSEVSLNDRRVSGGGYDIADERSSQLSGPPPPPPQHGRPELYAKPYGTLKPATPPVMVGGNRQVSSGNDYLSKPAGSGYGRRNVSGKMAEEGRMGPQQGGGGRFSRFSLHHG